MIYQNKAGLSALIVIATALSACGGANDGVSSISQPAAQAPTPPPPPPPAPLTPPPPPTGANGLVSDEPFAVLGISQNYTRNANGGIESEGASKVPVQFRYIASDNAYEMSLPAFETGRLKTLGYNGSYTSSTEWRSVNSTYNALSLGNTAAEQNIRITLMRPAGPLNPDVKLTHTSWGFWETGTGGPLAASGAQGKFVYGIPTAPGDVPLTGTATYNARVIGSTTEAYSGSTDFYTDYIDGSARLVFDFAAGSLSGSMKTVMCPWDCDTDLGTYDFTETVYATGSRTFSGKFLVPGSTADSFFEGQLNGPKAAELMARWKAPYLNPQTKVWGTMLGIWVGKKD